MFVVDILAVLAEVSKDSGGRGDASAVAASLSLYLQRCTRGVESTHDALGVVILAHSHQLSPCNGGGGRGGVVVGTGLLQWAAKLRFNLSFELSASSDTNQNDVVRMSGHPSSHAQFLPLCLFLPAISGNHYGSCTCPFFPPPSRAPPGHYPSSTKM
ncbi:hypothetical protein BDZ97DRAFT_2064598, partial [Flammula alnicola]